MEFGVLGPLQVDGVPFAGGPKPRALLTALLVAQGAVSAGRLIDVLWGDGPPASAAHALQVYVSELRKAGIAIERHGDGYWLRPSAAGSTTCGSRRSRIARSQRSRSGARSTCRSSSRSWSSIRCGSASAAC